MTRPFVALAVLLVLFGCNRPLVLQDYNRKPNIENVTDFQGFDRVLDDKDRVVGYVERQTVVVKGGTLPTDLYYVYNLNLYRVGFITDKGATYRYDADQKEEFIGSFPINEGAQFLVGHLTSPVKLAPYRN